MSIKERIEKVKPYFKEMQITTVNSEQVIYVIVQYPKNWVIDDDTEEKFDVSVQKGNGEGEYYYCASMDTGQDAVFDAIEANINHMKEAIERAQLLSAKVTELRQLFEDDSISLEKLRTLHFEYGEEQQPAVVFPKKKGKKTTAVPTAEPVAENTFMDKTAPKQNQEKVSITDRFETPMTLDGEHFSEGN